jgi:arginyl-tRNA synthetase
VAGPSDDVAADDRGLRARDSLRGPPAAAEGRADRGLGGPRADAVPRHRFGDDVDRPLMKSDGSYTYFASDIAYHKSSSTAASAT